MFMELAEETNVAGHFKVFLGLLLFLGGQKLDLKQQERKAGVGE